MGTFDPRYRGGIVPMGFPMVGRRCLQALPMYLRRDVPGAARALPDHRVLNVVRGDAFSQAQAPISTTVPWAHRSCMGRFYVVMCAVFVAALPSAERVPRPPCSATTRTLPDPCSFCLLVP